MHTERNIVMEERTELNMSEFAAGEGLISKKALLEKYGISYGALYRWKRKGLIPDEWFIKRSAVTGQETFFPERLVCERMEQIMSLKDEYSSDELSAKFSGRERSWSLKLYTEYGEKSFELSELKSVRLCRADGQQVDITDFILDFCKEEEK